VCFCIMLSSNLILAQNDPPLEIKGLAININSSIKNVSKVALITDIKEKKVLEDEFSPYKVDYKYSDTTLLSFLNYPVKNLGICVNDKNEVAAIYIACDYSTSIIQSMNKRYGHSTGRTGFGINVTADYKDFDTYVWFKGKIAASILRNGLFYNELSEKKDLVIISFTNGKPQDYLLPNK
jgi:hypothetical protein